MIKKIYHFFQSIIIYLFYLISKIIGLNKESLDLFERLGDAQ